MTVEEFKKIKPEYKDIEGEELYDAMTMYTLDQQKADEIIKSIKPIWKTHTLRWLYYRRIPNLVIGRDKWRSDKRCSKCKQGVNFRMGYLMIQKDGTQKFSSYCPHCGAEYQEEPNTNLSHKFYKIINWISKSFWMILDKIHLVRSNTNARYDMFGDESKYVKSWLINTDTGVTKPKLKSRKWWEYILIEKPYHNF
jgi:hypothetical protein